MRLWVTAPLSPTEEARLVAELPGWRVAQVPFSALEDPPGDLGGVVLWEQDAPASLLGLPGLQTVVRLDPQPDPLFPDLSARGVSVYHSRGIATAQAAHHALTLSLSLLTGLPAPLRIRLKREAGTPPLAEIKGLAVTVLGLGMVGQRVARLAKAYGFSVTGVGRTPRVLEGIRSFPWSSVPRLLPKTRLLLTCLPLTPETRHLLTGELLAMLPQGAVLVHLSRLDLLAPDALSPLLQEEALAGAALSVFRMDLPRLAPYRDLPNLTATPHPASYSPRFREKAYLHAIRHLARYPGRTMIPS